MLRLQFCDSVLESSPDKRFRDALKRSSLSSYPQIWFCDLGRIFCTRSRISFQYAEVLQRLANKHFVFNSRTETTRVRFVFLISYRQVAMALAMTFVGSVTSGRPASASSRLHKNPPVLSHRVPALPRHDWQARVCTQGSAVKPEESHAEVRLCTRNSLLPHDPGLALGTLLETASTLSKAFPMFPMIRVQPQS